MGSVRVPEGFDSKWERTDQRKKKERIQGKMAAEEERKGRKVAVEGEVASKVETEAKE